ncbi:hypothetical protein [Actinosynnema sp. NPDC020468]|uniref:hypothetical protein n=1 Tax=Actinosynnema sp. NPDC020468 TaxID=3154488 RepID=UPI0033F79B4C
MAGLTTIKRNGSRYYVHPETQEKFPGVTSILDMLPKPFLTPWASKLAAEYAADNIGAVVQLLVGGQRQAAVDMIKGASRRFVSEAADVGTEVHDLFEKRALGLPIGRPHPELVPYLAHIDDFLDTCQPRFLHVEDSVWSAEHRYAGSFDWIAQIDGRTFMGDTKSTRSGVHEPVAMQLAAYANADKIVTRAGAEIAVPAVDAHAVFHVRPEGWKLVPARAGRDVFDAFLVLRRVFDWETAIRHTVIGEAYHDSTVTTGATRRKTR